MLGHASAIGAPDEHKFHFINLNAAVWNSNRSLSLKVLKIIVTKFITLYLYKELDGEW